MMTLRFNFLKILALCAFLVVLLSGVCSASRKSLIYRWNDSSSGNSSISSVQIKNLPKNEQAFTVKVKGGDYNQFTIDKDYMTRHFRNVNSYEDTDYSGEKVHHTLFIKGLLNGRSIDKRIDLDDKPFYNMPQFNLTNFALSNKSHIYFWMLRADRIAKVQMEAKKRGTESMLINGVQTKVVKVACVRHGLREKHYQDFYYFRKSDGLFVKRITSTGQTVDLVRGQ